MRCKNCREKFIPKYMLQKYCMINNECIKHFAEQTKLKAWNEKKKKVKEDLLTVQDYLKLAQQVFNKYIRYRDKGKNCISCDKKALKENAGHMYSAGGHFNVRFDENNVHLQCEYCNTFLHGNLLKYRENLVKKIGYEAFEKLTVDSQLTRKFTVDELKQIIEKYKQKIKEYEKQM